MRERFVVSWWADVPVDENGDSDWDAATERYEPLSTVERAREFAATLDVPASIHRYRAVSAAEARESDVDVIRYRGEWWECVAEVANR